MDVRAMSTMEIFHSKVRFEIPLFQRPYVWTQEGQWEPLWEDFSRKFTEFIDRKYDAPQHFLGAIILDQQSNPTGSVERRQVIDGQQRLTTFQVFLAAFRDYSRASGYNDIADECADYTKNASSLTNNPEEQYKIWPSSTDRTQFTDVMSLGSVAAVEEKYPRTKKKRARKFDRRPVMVEAYLYFYQSISRYFDMVEDPETDENMGVSQAEKLRQSFFALKECDQSGCHRPHGKGRSTDHL